MDRPALSFAPQTGIFAWHTCTRGAERGSAFFLHSPEISAADRTELHKALFCGGGYDIISAISGRAASHPEADRKG